MDKEKSRRALRQAALIIEEMQGFLDSADPESPQAFLEAFADVQHLLHRALQDALVPLLVPIAPRPSEKVVR
jgi:hypothetical protein